MINKIMILKAMKKRGFTLVELVIAIVIIGILSAIAVPAYRKTTERARQAEGVHILGILREAQLRYYSEHGIYAVAAGVDNINSVLYLEFTEPKYFYIVRLLDGSSGKVANIVRNAEIQDVGYGSYVIFVTEDGEYGYSPLFSEGPGGLP